VVRPKTIATDRGCPLPIAFVGSESTLLMVTAAKVHDSSQPAGPYLQTERGDDNQNSREVRPTRRGGDVVQSGVR
jgi:hypothetical protein